MKPYNKKIVLENGKEFYGYGLTDIISINFSREITHVLTSFVLSTPNAVSKPTTPIAEPLSPFDYVR